MIVLITVVPRHINVWRCGAHAPYFSNHLPTVRSRTAECMQEVSSSNISLTSAEPLIFLDVVPNGSVIPRA
jgi:hypothetical protein